MATLFVDSAKSASRLKELVVGAASANTQLRLACAWESRASMAAMETINAVYGAAIEEGRSANQSSSDALRNIFSKIAVDSLGRKNAKDDPARALDEGLIDIFVDDMRSTEVNSDYADVLHAALDDALVIATQCVDGVASLNNLEVEHELYGNVFQKKCHSCGNEDASISVTADITESACPICSAEYFPNVSMFGWNTRECTQSELNKKLEMADCVWLLGVDEALLPIASSSFAEHHMTFFHIEKNQIRIATSEQQQILPIQDLAIYMKEMKNESELVDKLAKSEEKGGYEKMLKLLYLFAVARANPIKS